MQYGNEHKMLAMFQIKLILYNEAYQNLSFTLKQDSFKYCNFSTVRSKRNKRYKRKQIVGKKQSKSSKNMVLKCSENEHFLHYERINRLLQD